MLDLAVRLKAELTAGGNAPLFKGKVLAMIFQKPSLRTRVSFDMAMRHMGGDALYLSPNEIGLGKREAIADVARVHVGLCGCHDGARFRPRARGRAGKVVERPRGQWAVSDYNHPCQGMADALTIHEKFGSLKGLKVTFVGDGNNVAVSLLHVCAKLGAEFHDRQPGGL